MEKSVTNSIQMVITILMIPKPLDFERPSSSVNIILIKISENTTSDDVDAEQDDHDDDDDDGDDDDGDDIEDKCGSTRSGRASLLNYNRLVNWPQLLFHYSDFYL